MSQATADPAYFPPETSPAPEFIPSPTVEEFMYAVSHGDANEIRLLLLIGPRGEGKTVGTISACLELAARVQKEAPWALPVRAAVVRDSWVNLARALSVETPVLTLNGWVKAGDVAIGDTLISRDGLPTTVLGVYPQPAQPLWRVIFSDGTSARVTGDHLWAVQGRWDRELPGRRNRRCRREGWLPGPNGTRVVRTDQLRERLATNRRRQRAWSIPVVEPVQFPARPVPIDPYVLGALLGDGGLSQRSIRFTTADAEVAQEVGRRLPAGVTLKRVGGTPYDYRVCGLGRGKPNPVKEALVGLGLWGRRSPDKFIPDLYLWNDTPTRLDLLRGLMDTDGCATRDRHLSFSSSSERLIEGVEFIVRSLSGLTKRAFSEPGDAHMHRGRPVVRRRRAWNLSIWPPEGQIMFCLSRKVARVVSRQRQPLRWIVSVEPDGHGPAVCFRVDHPSRLFVINDFILTHNTTIVSFEEMRSKGLPIEFRDSGREAIIAYDVPLLHFYFFGLDRPEDADKLQGFQCGILIIEEAAPAAGLANGVAPEALGIGATSLRQMGVPPRILMPMNPPPDDHWVIKVEEYLQDLGLDEIKVARFTIEPGEKSAHFERLAQESTGDEAEQWGMAAKAFERYRKANKAFLESIGRHDLVARLAEGRTGDVQVGEAVMPYFSRVKHLAKEPVLVYPTLPLWRAWDCGGTPSCVWMQPLGPDRMAGLNIIGSRVAMNAGLEGFILNDVLAFQQKYGLMPRTPSTKAGWGKGPRSGFTYFDVGDPSMLHEGKTVRAEITAALLINQLLHTAFQPGPVEWAARRESGHSIFQRTGRGDRVAFVQIDPEENDTLIKGFGGRFRYPRTNAGKVTMTIEAAKGVSGIFAQPTDACLYGFAKLYPVLDWLRQHNAQAAPRVPRRRPKSFLGA